MSVLPPIADIGVARTAVDARHAEMIPRPESFSGVIENGVAALFRIFEQGRDPIWLFSGITLD